MMVSDMTFCFRNSIELSADESHSPGKLSGGLASALKFCIHGFIGSYPVLRCVIYSACSAELLPQRLAPFCVAGQRAEPRIADGNNVANR
jgi:hypothetical protein